MRCAKTFATPLAPIIGLSLAGAAWAGDLVPMKGHGSLAATGQTIDPTTGDIIIITGDSSFDGGAEVDFDGEISTVGSGK